MTEALGPKAGTNRAKLTVFSGWAAFVLGAACLAGWITGSRTLASLRPEYVPMAPDAGLLFMALGAVLFSGAYRKGRGFGRSLAFAFAILASCYGALKAVETFLGVDLTFQRVLFPETERLGPIALERMSPVTGILFFLSGLALLALLICRCRRRLLSEAAGGIAAIVFVAGGIAATGYLFGTPFLYGGATIPLAANTAAAFIFLGLGLTAAAGRDSVLMRELSGPSASARMLRGILPIIVLAILLQGLLGTRLAHVLNVNQALLSAILMLVLSAVTVVIVVRIAGSVFRRAEQAEAERRGAEEQLLIKEAALASSLSAIGLASMDGTLIYANGAFVKLWGYGRREAVLGRPVLEFAGSEEQVRDVIATLRAGNGYVGEVSATRADGTSFFVQLSANLVTSSDGRPLCMMASFLDVTERARAEEALRRSEERFRQIAENEGDFIWEIDANGLYTYASPVVAKILGYGPEELVGKLHFYDLFAPDVREELSACAMETITRKEAFQAFVNPNLRKDGARIILETSGSPIIGESGEILGYRGSDKDITERVAAEAALRDTVNQKEFLMKELQHRVKNSLAMVSGLLGLEMEGIANARCHAAFEKTRTRIRAVAALYERLYRASDIDTVDLRAHLRGLTEELFKTYGFKDIRLTTRFDEFRLDTKRAVPLGLILNELVTNALKYAYPGGAAGEVRVELARTGDGIRLSVADDGAGLPKDFDPAESGGTGMSLVRMLAAEIDGKLTFERQKGTRVSLFLKAEKDPQ